ncbi:hypothetical protein [Exiguobacterium sp. s133]|uniref:P-loop ATPase, Sll1717 family n=1 Tax=Exiguobacterium sp. s133 TaxID=2751213 RepID=UPI001BE9D9E7|nr:hypothetical protein [Exiguobacterium sp. s133]
MDIKEWLPSFKVSAESDKDLMRYFLKTQYLTDIIDLDKWMVLGRKGTGKTAIFEYLKNSDPSSINGYNVISLDFSNYPWPIHQLYKESMEGELTAYQKSWNYLFIVQAISKLISLKEQQGIKLNKELKEAKKLLQEIFGNPNPNLTEVIKSKIMRIKTLSSPNMGMMGFDASLGEVAFEEIGANEQLKSRLKSNSFTILDYLEKIYLDNIGEEKILIILDHLDENWLEDGIHEYSKILINLINISKFINNSSAFASKLKIVPFLRIDIYETLRFNDKNKIYQDSATEIMWSEESLNSMFLERIQNYKPSHVELNLGAKTNSVFEVRYVRHGATPFKHIIRRSFLRPRDIIVYMNKINDIHNSHSSKADLYSSKDLYDAEKEFSVSMYNEIIDEWNNQKPEIAEILSVIQSIGYQTFKYEDFETKYDSIFRDGKAKETVHFLFNNSILGQKINANWEYYCGNPYMNIDYEKPFHANSALKSRLMLTEGQV